MLQRRCTRDENFGGSFAFAIFDLLATILIRFDERFHTNRQAAPAVVSGCWNGMPSMRNSSRASSSLPVEVTSAIFKP